MKIVTVSTMDNVGGAGRATYRLHQGLKQIGISSTMLVQSKSTDDDCIFSPASSQGRMLANLRPFLEKLPLLPYKNRLNQEFSSLEIPDNLLSRIHGINPDIVNLTWIGAGYVKIETLAKVPVPIIWTLMDMWPFTGGCHYAGQCIRYHESCGSCPQLGSKNDQDISHNIWQRKMKSWSNQDMTIVSPSHWLADCLRESSLMGKKDVRVIPFSLDTQVYRPHDKLNAREILGLPKDKVLILFGALNSTKDFRKGWHLLKDALIQLSHDTSIDKDIECVIFGASRPSDPVELGFETHFLGHLFDDISLSLVYSSADVMVVPSVEEAFGQTAMESIACGTPVVTFAETGVADIVDHQLNGYLATPYEVDSLAQGISWVISDTELHHMLSVQARTKAEKEFSLEVQAKRYKNLAEEILERWK